MEKSLVFKAQIREQAGTKLAKRLRKQDRIPAVIYGHKQESVSVSLEKRNVVDGLNHGLRVFDVDIDGKSETVMFKALQYDHLGRDIIHVDLMRVDVTEKVKVSVQIALKGIAEGTKEGGIIEEHASALEVECMVNAIPESLVVNIKDLKVGDNIHASDVELPEGVVLASDPSLLVLACNIVAAAKSTEELEEEAPAGPEVIGEKKEEEASE